MALGNALAGDLISQPQNVFLFGELGAGKTTFLKGLGRGLGIKESIISPSFQLVRKYTSESGLEFIHIDLYRLNDLEDIQRLGWLEMIEGTAVTAVEWSDRAAPILPEEGIFIKIEHVSPEARRLEITRK
jgi:tRNA threonylcarbamoyladenosine biosynthesis protein TsaE